ncbi:hypothetical protein TH62_05025 [Bacillus sp. TH008]|nr:hypothetical protein TH62_05025 [Bacillus sp. TH008]
MRLFYVKKACCITGVSFFSEKKHSVFRSGARVFFYIDEKPAETAGFSNISKGGMGYATC